MRSVRGVTTFRPALAALPPSVGRAVRRPARPSASHVASSSRGVPHPRRIAATPALFSQRCGRRGVVAIVVVFGIGVVVPRSRRVPVVYLGGVATVDAPARHEVPPQEVLEQPRAPIVLVLLDPPVRAAVAGPVLP